ncbi:hypothetical protein, partial [Ralstonia pseudosolanacearum]|uniref:hypothetical protein n=1 Tax=Ralstonia pseudosolanacearum TaxID=1310165 RepID=UPI001E53109B
FPAKIENLRRNPVCLQRYRHVVARKRQHGLTTTLIYATTPPIRRRHAAEHIFQQFNHSYI